MTALEPSQAELKRIAPRHAASVFVVSVILGAGIPVARRLVWGAADPFQDGWPLFLQGTACLAAFMVSWRWKRWMMSAVGLYAGLAAYMMALGNPEYPVATGIALAIHGFIPALAGSLIALAISGRSGHLPQSATNA